MMLAETVLKWLLKNYKPHKILDSKGNDTSPIWESTRPRAAGLDESRELYINQVEIWLLKDRIMMWENGPDDATKNPPGTVLTEYERIETVIPYNNPDLYQRIRNVLDYQPWDENNRPEPITI